MTLARIRDTYGVPAHRGARVWFQGRPHVITGATRDGMRLRARPASGGTPVLLHPTWEMVYDEPHPAPITAVQLDELRELATAADLPPKVYAKIDDSIGGWCVMPADITPSYAPPGVRTIAHFIDEPTARLIAALLNAAPSLLHAAGHIDQLTMPRIDEATPLGLEGGPDVPHHP